MQDENKLWVLEWDTESEYKNTYPIHIDWFENMIKKNLNATLTGGVCTWVCVGVFHTFEQAFEYAMKICERLGITEDDLNDILHSRRCGSEIKKDQTARSDATKQYIN